ncbi:MAG: DUF2799 domain-containing protein [Amphiplicatus sp.]
MTGRMMAAFFGALALAGCATKMSEEECAFADWSAVGDADGRSGQAREAFGARAERCATFGVTADYDAYFAGRERGLQAYCTPGSGYEAGRRGEEYRGVCPAGVETGFLEEYRIGRQLYTLEQAHNSAVSAYDYAISSIDSSRDSIQRARKKLRESGLSEEEREKLRKRIDSERRDIERTERELPYLAGKIDEAFGRLEDYRAYLRRRY